MGIRRFMARITKEIPFDVADGEDFGAALEEAYMQAGTSGDTLSREFEALEVSKNVD